MSRNINLCFTKIKSPPPPENKNPPSHLFKSFNSLYEDLPAPGPASAPSTPDLATAFASRRFFFSSPGRSNSIVDSSASSSSSASSIASASSLGSEAAVAVPTYSPDPFADFRRSMQEMVEARGVRDVEESWDYLHELLTCYLSLNPKATHKFIVGAFADLLVALIAGNSRRNIPFSAGKRKIPPIL
ncbi:transcription repressor OFP16-like [Salvia divinorum]|uniref:Transcription repressor n=1 Tax=Salvia divinorum TaxID=28513 RepID=A0ABD1GSY1_SALDI